MSLTKSVLYVICESCGNGVFSRCIGDRRECGCGNVIVEEMENGHTSVVSPKSKHASYTVNTKYDEFRLYEDFEEMNDRFGLVVDGVRFLKQLNSSRVAIKPRNHFEDEIENFAYLCGSA